MMYDELIKRLRDCTAEQNGEKTLWRQAADAIEELTDTNVGKWIPVTERLPEDGTHCLVTRNDYVTKTHFVDLLWFDNSWWWDRLNSGDYAVTHWMPLPQPPKEE